MAGPTRFHIARLTAADISPAFDAEWEHTSSTLRRAMNVAGYNDTIVGTAVTDGTATADRNVLMFQFVSDAIAAGPISGTLKGQIQALEAAPGLDARMQMIVRVVSNDGSTFRGTLYGPDTAALSSEFASTRTNRNAPRGGAVTLTTVPAQTNDRIVIEIGYRKHAASASGATLYVGAVTASADLPEDETTTTMTLNPWFEFSADLYTARPFGGARAYIID